MPSLADIFTFWVGSRQVFPYYEDLIFDDQDRTPVSKQRILTTPLVFRGADYSFFNSLRNSDGVCGRLDFEVRQGGSVRFKGVGAVAFGEWSPRDAVVTLTPQVNDDWACYDRVAKDKVNILTLTKVDQLRIIVGQIEEEVCQVAYQGPPENLPPNLCLPDAIGWTLVNREAQVRRNDEGIIVTEYDRATYQREVFLGVTPPGLGWQEVSPGKWARPLFTRTILNDFERDFPEDLLVLVLFQTTEVVGSTEASLPDNGVAMNTVINRLAGGCGYDIRSNFFDLNPDGTAPDNDVYNSDIYKNLVLFQKTDIKNIDADQNATRGEISLEELEEFWALLEVYPSIENNILRIEHISYYNRNGADFSQYLEPYQQTDTTFSGDDIPRRETFAWMDQGNDPDFDGRAIEYDPFCTGGDERPIASDLFSTNYADIVDNPEEYVNEGFVAVATYPYAGTNYIYVDFVPNSDPSRLNAPMAWSYIQDRLYRHNRQLPEGTMNGELVTFEDSIPQAKQQPVTIPLTYDQYFAYIAGRRARTQRGWGKVEQSSYSARDQILTLQVSHNE